ncbi:hypothetical protein CDD80_3250 [Ophiocordyceps camponoti-rufipedis]|uniref:Uncharacterized protein n=1 Tax=Ophiocordyceps camponoti-rufipedis TaxID=2004952 RepID=A0A2C5ZDJ5_9HYPO|nr:hypothetical protein CDD80_3250 [Ophiocordyceps camponoti-rufipedis]
MGTDVSPWLGLQGSEVARSLLDDDFIPAEVVAMIDEAGDTLQTLDFSFTKTLDPTADPTPLSYDFAPVALKKQVDTQGGSLKASNAQGSSETDFDVAGDDNQLDVFLTEPLDPTADAAPQSYDLAPGGLKKQANTQGASTKASNAQGSSKTKPDATGNYKQLDVQPAATPAGGNATDSKQFGISYAPYRTDHQCKSQDDINSDLQQLSKYYSTVRIYGTDCEQVGKVVQAAKTLGMKVFAGIWDPKNLDEEVKLLQEGVGDNWDMINFVSVGNELVNSNQATAADMASAVEEARNLLRKAGYNGPVTTVDTFNAYQQNVALGNASDHCTINAHAYFDPTISADNAGQWLKKTVDDVRKTCPQEKKVVVTETGWPTQGNTNGQAIPGVEQQAAALNSMRTLFAQDPSQVYFFSAFNDLWKNPGNLNTEQYWGIDNHVA